MSDERPSPDPVPDLVTRCRAGDERAWRALVDRYAGMVVAIGRASGLTAEGAEDLTQAVFGAFARSLGAIESDGAVGAWLRTTATREAWRMARRERRWIKVDRAAGEEHTRGESPEPIGFAAQLEQVETHQRLRHALAELGGRCRDLLQALYFGPDRGAYERVEAALGMPHGSIGPTRRRCMEKLAALFRGDGTDADGPSSA